jgi:hypothetical protein
MTSIVTTASVELLKKKAGVLQDYMSHLSDTILSNSSGFIAVSDLRSVLSLMKDLHRLSMAVLELVQMRGGKSQLIAKRRAHTRFPLVDQAKMLNESKKIPPVAAKSLKSRKCPKLIGSPRSSLGSNFEVYSQTVGPVGSVGSRYSILRPLLHEPGICAPDSYPLPRLQMVPSLSLIKFHHYKLLAFPVPEAPICSIHTEEYLCVNGCAMWSCASNQLERNACSASF